MVDWLLTLAIQHYLVFGIVSIAAGVMLNVLITAAPEIVEELRFRKLF
jgi:hypothetical protein